MAHENPEDGLIRRYLLAQLGEDELQQLEERIMVDTEFFNRVLLAEDEMVEAYVNRKLSESDREKFEDSFMSTPEGRRQVNVVEELHAKADHLANNLKTFVAETQSGAQGGKDSGSAPLPRTPSVRDLPWWSRLTLVPSFRWAAIAVLVTAVGLGAWIVSRLPQNPPVSQGLAALREAFPEQRPTQARIVDFGYAKPPPVTRGTEGDKFDYVAMDRAKFLIPLEAREHPSANAYHDLGRLYLAQHDPDKAIDQFEKALKLDERNARLYSDLGAALLEKGIASELNGEQGKSYEEFGRSNEHLSKALELDGSLLEALFNRALCRERMNLDRQAEEDWKKYLEKDRNSGWANEARQRLKKIEERSTSPSQVREQLFQDFMEAHGRKDDDEAWKLISQSRDSTGSSIENRLVDDYLDLASKGQSKSAEEFLNALSYAGDLESQRANDLFVRDLVRFYKVATPRQRQNITEGRAAMRRGRECFSRPDSTPDFDAALEFHGRAKELFERATDTCGAMYAVYNLGNCYTQKPRADLALPLYEPLAQSCERAQYKWLHAQTLSAMANARLYFRDFSAAMELTERSMNLSKEIGDNFGFLRSLFQFAEEHRYVNKPQKALDLHVRDLALSRAKLLPPAQLWKSYFSIGLTYYQLDLHSTAIDFQREALKLALEAGDSRFICRSYNYLAMLLAREGNYAEAKSNIERALDIGNAFTKRDVRIEVTAPCFQQLGYVHRQLGDFKKATENYDQAIQFYDELNLKFFSYTARKEKLLSCMESGECESLAADMETLLNLFEEQRSKILEESSRSTYFDAEQGIYDIAIEYEFYKKKDAERAFDYSERSRGRSLTDSTNNSGKIVDNPYDPDRKFDETSQPKSIDDIRFLMPAEAQVLQYAVLRNSVLIWVVNKSRDKFFAASEDVPIGDLNKRVKNFLDLISRSSESDFDEFSDQSKYLYDLLIKPVENALDPTRLLCIVPDKILNHLPFAALRSQSSGKYFVVRQERGFVLSPSSTLFAISSEAARERNSSNTERLLSVGNPLFDRKSFPGYAPLGSADTEARAIAKCYGSQDPLIGASATKQRVMDEMETADVIHLATHAITDPWNPLRSKLLLAKGASDKDSDGILRADEIYKLDLSHTKLVVLSACQTGIERYYGGEGMVGLSRPFIAKRIPLVVASLWKVNSESTADLMISFHKFRKQGGLPTAEALRKAQIQMMEDAGTVNHLPYHWASFVTIGGHASF